MAIFTPLRNYAGHEHVLNALPTFAHQNGNLYGIAIEKQAGVRQNLTVYRKRPGASAAEQVHRFVGGVDSAAQIAAGGCAILPNGSLEVWASAVPMGIPPITKTGFVGGWWDPIPGIDDPWSSGGGVKLFDVPLTHPTWEGRQMAANTGVLIDIPAVFGAPVASVYVVRFVVVADGPNIRARAGTERAPFILTANTKAAGVEEHLQGDAPGPICYVSTAQGAAKVWFQIVGVAG